MLLTCEVGLRPRYTRLIQLCTWKQWVVVHVQLVLPRGHVHNVKAAGRAHKGQLISAAPHWVAHAPEKGVSQDRGGAKVGGRLRKRVLLWHDKVAHRMNSMQPQALP